MEKVDEKALSYMLKQFKCEFFDDKIIRNVGLVAQELGVEGLLKEIETKVGGTNQIKSIYDTFIQLNNEECNSYSIEFLENIPGVFEGKVNNFVISNYVALTRSILELDQEFNYGRTINNEIWSSKKCYQLLNGRIDFDFLSKKAENIQKEKLEDLLKGCSKTEKEWITSSRKSRVSMNEEMTGYE